MTMAEAPATPTRRSRSGITKDHLLRAAEKLFARDGLANVSVRAIVIEAGQKNESALQYHFGNRDGLIAALHEERNAQIRVQCKRTLDAMLATHPNPTLREIAFLMVRPAFELAARDPGFRDYLKSFAHLLLYSSERLTGLLLRQEDTAAHEIRHRLRVALPDLHGAVFALRFDDAARFAALALSRLARERAAFTGRSAEFYFNNLVDTLAAILAAKPSSRTLELINDFHQEPPA